MTDQSTPETSQPSPEFLADALRAVENQRNHAQNECVNLAAALQAEYRKLAARDAAIVERDARIAELEAKVGELEANQLPPLTADGRDVHVIN